MVKSPAFVPVNPMLLMVMVPLPELVRVAVFGPPALPTATEFQLIEVGDTLADPVVDAPVPDKATESGVEELLLVMDQVAVREPEAPGAKTMFAVQLAEATRLEPQVVEATEKSPALVPEMPALLRVTELEVLLLTVMACELLVDPS